MVGNVPPKMWQQLGCAWRKAASRPRLMDEGADELHVLYFLWLVTSVESLPSIWLSLLRVLFAFPG